MKKKKNIYLLAGGNWRKPDLLMPLFREILTETGKEKPRVAYIGTANEDDPSFFTFSDSLLKKAGAGTVTQIFLAENDVNLPLAKSALSKADAVFVAGGDVDEGMRWLNLHKLVPFLKKLYQNGMLFFGLSAGSIMLGTQWVRWRNPDDDSSAELFECIGIAPIICDTHAEKEKWEELQAAIELSGKNGTGYGIPTGGILRVAPDGKLTALEKNAACYAKQANRIIKEADISADNK
jgi:peptidase E